MNKEEALRFNIDKLRYELLEPYAIEELVKVFTAGAKKYSDNNWLKGMPFSKMIASLKRHIAAFEKGEDYDLETGCNHMGHAAWNALGIISYMKLNPQWDDRNLSYLREKRIALDLDDVCVSFAKPWCDKYNLCQAKHWNFSYGNKIRFTNTDKKELEEFYLSLPPAIDPSLIPFEPIAYITARGVDTHISEKWIESNGFPTAPVYTVGWGKSKVDTIKELNINYFIDDSYSNFVELNKAGICTFLWDAAHNQKHSVGYKRIYSFGDFKNRFL